MAAPAFGRVAVVELGEPRLPRGVIYNLPPEPTFAHGYGREVIRAKY